MKPTSLIAAAIGLAALITGPSLADCVDTTTSTQAQAHTGISKDGTHAPLESEAGTEAQAGPATGTTTTSPDTATAAPQKDGTNMPMNEGTDVAASTQDAEAQQQGEQTAAATAGQDKCDE